MPVYAVAFGFFAFASAGLPGLSGFVGEFLSLVGAFLYNPAVAAIATVCMILAAAYLLWMYQRVFFGEVSDFLRGIGSHLTDVTPIEVLTLAPLAALVVIFGIFPGLLLNLIAGSVANVLADVAAEPAIVARARDRGDRDPGPDPLRRRPAGVGVLRRLARRDRRRRRCGRRHGGRWPVIDHDFALIAAARGGDRDRDRRPPDRPHPARTPEPCGRGRPGRAVAGRGGDALRLPDPGRRATAGAYRVDALTTFLDMLFVSIISLTLVFAPDYLTPRDLPMAEFAVVLMFAMTGAMLIAGSTDLLVLFIGLELMVLPGYMLAAFHKSDGYSTEGAIKYFLLGSFSSAIFLFGLSFVWGLTGSTRIVDVAASLGAVAATPGALSPGLAMGFAFMTTGVAFKIAAVPFHYWTPDAYQGSPTPVTGYLSVGPKIGAFALILRLFAEAARTAQGRLAAGRDRPGRLTMTVGNLVAITQDNVKRMLAYSSIAHTGYMLVGLAAYAGGQQLGLEGLLFYGAAYSLMNLGAFAVIAALQKRGGVTSSLDTFAGLGRREPLLGILMTLFLLSLTGHPADRRLLRQGVRDPGRRRGRRAGSSSSPSSRCSTPRSPRSTTSASSSTCSCASPRPDVAPPRHGRLLWSGLAVATAFTILLGFFPTLLFGIIGEAATALGA